MIQPSFISRLWIALLFIFPLVVEASPSDKTILLAILARNKEHTLPLFLNCLENQDYDKSLITIYIHTNDNVDQTSPMLHRWAEKWKGDYREIIFEEEEFGLPRQNPHDWNAARFHVLGSIRNDSLYMTRVKGCDFYFVVDCDNFIMPETLTTLVAKNKPIIAPMLRAIPEFIDYYSNFFCAVDANGYWQDHPDYYDFLSETKRGTFSVPLVHCTYLVRSDVIDQLSYIDNSNDYEFVIFSKTARKNGIPQYLCNESDFGLLLHFFDSEMTLSQEKTKFQEFLVNSRFVDHHPLLQQYQSQDN